MVLESLAAANAVYATIRTALENPREIANVVTWDAQGDNSEGLVVYNGTSWVAV
jgi:hypothetical protein